MFKLWMWRIRTYGTYCSLAGPDLCTYRRLSVFGLWWFWNFIWATANKKHCIFVWLCTVLPMWNLSGQIFWITLGWGWGREAWIEIPLLRQMLSINQSVSQSVSQSISQSVSQSVNQSLSAWLLHLLIGAG